MHNRSDVYFMDNPPYRPWYEKVCGEEAGVKQVISSNEVEPKLVLKQGLTEV